MSKRKTKVMSVNISAGTFATFEEAVKEANAIKIWIVRLCQKRGYSCKAKIGISKNNAHTGTVTTTKGGKGRQKKTFKRNTGVMLPTEVEAHIHIVLYGNPADMIVKELREHLNKKYKRSVVWTKDCSDYVSNAVNYLIKQSIKVRSLEYDRQDILSADEWGFCRAVQTAEDEIYGNNAFTNSVSQESAENLENTSISGIQNNTAELQYKSKKNQTFRDSIDVSSGKRFNVKNFFDILQYIPRELLTTHSPALSHMKLYLFCDSSV